MTNQFRRIPALLLAMIMALGTLLGPVAVQGQEATPAAATPAAGDDRGAVDLDVLFIGAHPDDEAFGLATYGQWNEYDDVNVGVITITRGEGGGNAAGPEEGPALGLIREQEERSAVGRAGIEHVFYLDKVDFYYTVSAPLTEQTWGYDDTLARVVRIVRATTPDVIVTMNPSPTPGNHGHHQMAARFAVAAYNAAGDPSMFPEQIEDEGLQPWAPGKIFRGGFSGESVPGEACATTFTPTEPTDVVYGVWSGRVSEANGGESWAAIARDGQRQYVSQGWSVFPDVSDNPDELGCGYFTLVDSRVPYTVGNGDPTAMLEGALTDTTGGLPAGTLFEVETQAFDVEAGQPFDVDIEARAAQASDIAVSLELPEGWTSEVADSENDGDALRETVTITPSPDAESATRYRLVATLTVDGASGQNIEVVNVVPPVEGHVQALPQISQFRDWVQQAGAPQLDNLIKPVLSMGVGESRDVEIEVTNNSTEEQNASVTVVLAEGFEADEDTKPVTVAAGESVPVTFTITNTDPTLPTSVEGGINGDYLFDIRTVGAGVNTTEVAGLNLVPVVSVAPAGEAAPAATPASATPVSASASPVAESDGPVVDGAIADGEYSSAPIDLSRVWEGDVPDSAADASGTAWLSYDDNGIYVAVQVNDDVKGTILPASDAKRHWRTDSVEIAIDPLGTAENTSSTFKVGIFPEVQEGGPAAYRDADAWQGPVDETAPGMELASSVSDPYRGYVIETFIPYDALPAPVDPDGLAMNIFIYDSDTEDLTGQSRLGWSVWGGVQGDPYRWGHVTLEGYDLSDGGEVAAPKMPLDAAQTAASPWSIIQLAEDGVGLAGEPLVADAGRLSVSTAPTVADGQLSATITGGDAGGHVHILAVGPDGIVAQQEATIEPGGSVDVALDVGDADPADLTLAISLVTDNGGTQAVAEPVTP